MKSPAFLLSAAVFLIALSSVSAFEWSECPDEKSKLQTLTDVKLHPEPVPVGSTANFTIRGYSEVAAESNTLKLTVYYLGLPVFRGTESSPWQVEKGDFEVSFARKFPSYTPPGSYKVKIESLTGSNELLICLDVKFKVTWGSWTRAYE